MGFIYQLDYIKNAYFVMQQNTAVSELISAASDKGFTKLRETHLSDYQNLFSRVDLSFKNEVPEGTTNSLLESYRKGDTNLYIEELIFQYAR